MQRSRLAGLSLVLLLILSSAAGLVRAQEWTRFRGPNGTGVSDAATIPATWTDEDYNWKVELPGVGHSSPVVWDDRVFVTSAMPDTAEQVILCFSAADGRAIWEQRYDSHHHPQHARSSFASATPAVDAERVYVTWGTPEANVLLALDHDGKEVWRRDFGPHINEHGAGVSLVVYHDMVLLPNDQDGKSSLIAVDARTGQTRWEVPRETARTAYATPCVLSGPDGDVLVFNSQSHGISGHDPASGETLWELPVFDKRPCSSPVLVGDLVLGSCGSGAGGNYVVALRPGSRDRATPPAEAWRVTQQAPYVPTPVAKGDLVFLWSDRGVVTCVSATDGKQLWRERVGNNFSGSPVVVGDKVVCIAEDGEVFVIRAADKYELLGQVKLGEDSRATPAVANGRLYLRTNSHLFSLGGKQE